jgi:hypothetical protein
MAFSTNSPTFRAEQAPAPWAPNVRSGRADIVTQVLAYCQGSSGRSGALKDDPEGKVSTLGVGLQR